MIMRKSHSNRFHYLSLFALALAAVNFSVNTTFAVPTKTSETPNQQNHDTVTNSGNQLFMAPSLVHIPGTSVGYPHASSSSSAIPNNRGQAASSSHQNTMMKVSNEDNHGDDDDSEVPFMPASNVGPFVRKMKKPVQQPQNILLKSPIITDKTDEGMKVLYKIYENPALLRQIEEVHVDYRQYSFFNLKYAPNIKKIRLDGFKTFHDGTLYDLSEMKRVYQEIIQSKPAKLKSIELVDNVGMSIVELALLADDKPFIEEMKKDNLVNLGDLSVKPVASQNELRKVNSKSVVKVCRHLGYFPQDYTKIRKIDLSYKNLQYCYFENSNRLEELKIQVEGRYKRSDKEPDEQVFNSMVNVFNIFRGGNKKHFPFLSAFTVEDHDLQSLLHLAVMKGDFNLMRRLLEDNLINVNAMNLRNKTPIFSCLSSSFYMKTGPSGSAAQCVQSLHEKGAALKFDNPHQATEDLSYYFEAKKRDDDLLVMAAKFGDMKVITYLEQNAPNLFGSPELKSAIMSTLADTENRQDNWVMDFKPRRMEVCLYLIDKLALNHDDLSAGDYYDILRSAIYSKELDIVKKILDKIPRSKDAFEFSDNRRSIPLLLDAVRVNDEMVKMILDHKLSQKALHFDSGYDNNFESPLTEALFSQKLDIARRLIYLMEEPDLAGAFFHVAFKNAHPESVKFLLRRLKPNMLLEYDSNADKMLFTLARLKKDSDEVKHLLLNIAETTKKYKEERLRKALKKNSE